METTTHEPLASSSVSHCTSAGDLPWVTLGPGRSFKPLRFLRNDRGWVQLLRLEPGVRIARHRHTGEVHAYNVQGRRRLHTGEIVGPGDYVYEPPGNVDSWEAYGEEAVIVEATVFGAVEYIEDDGSVRQRVDARSLRELYRRHCEVNGLPFRDLGA